MEAHCFVAGSASQNKSATGGKQQPSPASLPLCLLWYSYFWSMWLPHSVSAQRLPLQFLPASKAIDGAGVLIAVAQTRRGRHAPLEVRKYQCSRRMTIVFPLLPLASRVGVWWALSCSSSLACLPASQLSRRHAVWTQTRATGLQGREERRVCPAPPVSLRLAAQKLTVATVYFCLRVAVTPKTGDLCDGDAPNVFIFSDLYKNVLFIRSLLSWLQGGSWRRIRLLPLSRQCASCNEMRWQRQQQHSSFITAINWYSWSRMKILHIAFGEEDCDEICGLSESTAPLIITEFIVTKEASVWTC